MPRKPSSPKQTGNIKSDRDVILGNQINQYSSADLTRVEAQLGQIIALLRVRDTTLHVEGDVRDSVIVVGGSSNTVSFRARDLPLLRALSAGDSHRREEIYLTEMILDKTHARWDRLYLPLAGRLGPAQMPSDVFETKMRFADSADPGISAAGIPLTDVRDALTELNKPRLVILGEPGAGKTTTLERLMLDLALARLREPHKNKLPFHTELADFIGERQQPEEFLEAKWGKSGLAQTYADAILTGQVCFLLDGINQMPWADRNERIMRWARWARALASSNWAVFTCRTADFVPLLGLPEVRVQTLDNDQIRRYFGLRFGEPRATDLWLVFEHRLRGSEDRFQRVARNPFMLAQLVARCDEGKPLTDSRALLMQDLAKRLLDRELANQPEGSPLTADPIETFGVAMDELSRIAYDAQARGESTNFTRAQLEHVLLGEPERARLSLDRVIHLATRATIIEDKRDQGYAFYHQLLLEYFAARELLRRFRAGETLAQHWRVGWRVWHFMPKRLQRGQRMDPPPTTGWEEPVVMAAGMAVKDAPRFIDTVQKDNLPLAGRCLAEIDTSSKEMKSLVSEVRMLLLQRQRDSFAHLRGRISAGLALGELGHPELVPQKFECEGRVVWAIVPPMQPVPAGEFIRGSERGKSKYADEFTNERRIALPEFNIARYPVTNAEYELFIDDGGYRTDRWWSDAGCVWKQGGPDAHKNAMEDLLAYRKRIQTEKESLEARAKRLNWVPQTYRYWNEVIALSDEQAEERIRQQFDRPFDRPGYWEDRDGLASPGKPVVGVNWYEAEAYCNWLSAITKREFRLPQEMEWEKAARGVDGREYPWGEKFDSALCNTNESHIYTTTPVGLYPGGVSPFGLFDASGNVWEWTGDWYQMYPGGNELDDFGEKFRVVRGGSWLIVAGNARCAYRGRFVPVDFNGSVGFRLCSPGSIPAS
ncbi:MAG: SUMF1/EgtB/PvdO family nonheme iron enzyme [Chloroflexi bacterium]|nr:SUMF1/EgtB/PvdO family nonheme iron enzyme [Chloroflexota bacterium]